MFALAVTLPLAWMLPNMRFFPSSDPPAGILSPCFRVIQTLPHHINVHAAVLPRRLVRNIATMCSISARAARSAVWVIATALPGSSAKWPPRWRDWKNAEQMLRCHSCLSASACDEAACSQWVSLALQMGAVSPGAGRHASAALLACALRSEEH